MAKPYLTDRRRESFEEMFIDLGEARAAADRREDVSRVMYALTEPMLPAQQAMNAYKRRMLHASESGNTVHGIAAVHAFQRDLLLCANKDGAGTHFLRDARHSMLRRAADTASSNAFSKELDCAPSGIAAIQTLREFEAWLDENLDEMDREIAAAEEASLNPAPTPR